MALWTPFARIIQALRAIPTQDAADIHPHDWHLPESLLDAPPIVGVAAALAAWRILRRLLAH